jgi:hypothetical protein
MRKSLYLAAGASIAMVAMAATVPADASGVQHGRTAAAKADPTNQVVADDLHNPRQLIFAGDALYVAEAGQGGAKPCMPGPEGGVVCFGNTGSVTRVWHGVQKRVAKGLPSLGDQGTGDSAIGPADLLKLGGSRIALTVGLGTDPANRSLFRPRGKRLGTLMSLNLRTGNRYVIADLARHEAVTNPIDDPDSDPTGLARLGHRFVATDSGGNTLVKATYRGDMRTIAVFPDTTIPGGLYLSVPTDVVRGPDGALYVSELTGFPFPKGAAQIFRVVPGHAPTVYASGLTNVTSLTFDKRGTLYAVQIADEGLASGGPPVGSLLRVAPDGSGQTTTAVASGLFAPYGVAIHHGSAYVSTCSVCAVGGQVVRIPLS